MKARVRRVFANLVLSPPPTRRAGAPSERPADSRCNSGGLRCMSWRATVRGQHQLPTSVKPWWPGAVPLAERRRQAVLQTRCMSLTRVVMHSSANPLLSHGLQPRAELVGGWIRAGCVRKRTMATSETAGPDTEQRDKARRIWTIPNIICITRIAGTPVLCWWISTGEFEMFIMSCGRC